MARVVIAGGGALGAALQQRLAPAHEVRLARAELTSLPSTEVALAGAQVVVHLSRVSAPVARLPRANPADVELLIADTLARASRLVGAQRLVHFANGPQDPRVPLLERSGVPLAVLRGGGPDPLEHLVALVNGAPSLETPAWTPAPREPTKPPRFTTCSVQRVRRPKGWTALELARAYFTWLPSDVPTVRTVERAGTFSLFAAGVRALVLRHVAGRSDADVAWLDVADGVLLRAGPRPEDARFEFRHLLDGTTSLVAQIDFQPALPFLLYRFTQAVMHERVMRRFGAWLERQA